MNDFEKSLKVEGVIGKVNRNVSKNVNTKSGKAKAKLVSKTPEFDEQVGSVILESLSRLRTNNVDEEIRKVEYMLNINRFIKDFDKQILLMKEKESEEREKDLLK